MIRLHRPSPDLKTGRSRRAGAARVWLALGGAVLASGLAAGPAAAQGKLEGRYVAKLAGVPLGQGTWNVEIGEDQYSASASGGTGGILRLFSSGKGNGAARGKVLNGALAPSTYSVHIEADSKADDVRLIFAGPNIRDYSADPVPPPDPERVELTEAHRRNVLDPMTASFIPAAGGEDGLVAESCARKIPIFDGRMRYDLTLEFKRMDKVKAEKGYQGPALVCSVYFTPIAGHIPSRAALKYLAETRDMEITYAPVAGTHYLVPFKFGIPTPLGGATLEASQFIATRTPVVAKTQ